MRVLITGGGGFLGRHLAARLKNLGNHVAVLGRRKYSDLAEGIESIQADIRDREAVFRAARERDTVFHTAALPGIWGDPRELYSVHVDGTRNVIDACRAHGVSRLIHTSSPSVVFNQSDMENVDESVPYPESYLCEYPRTKAIGERMVLEANGVDGLATVSLRPHLIWGPGDPHLVPRIIERAQKGKLLQVGAGRNRVDIVYIDNAVHAHVRAGEVLKQGSPVAGRCYFISDGNPVVLWDWINQLLEKLDLPRVKRSLSYPAAKILGLVLEKAYGLLGILSEPPMTRFLASQLATSHYFDITRARRELGYEPIVGQEEGMNRLIRYFQAHPAG